MKFDWDFVKLNIDIVMLNWGTWAANLASWKSQIKRDCTRSSDLCFAWIDLLNGIKAFCISWIIQRIWNYENWKSVNGVRDWRINRLIEKKTKTWWWNQVSLKLNLTNQKLKPWAK